MKYFPAVVTMHDSTTKIASIENADKPMPPERKCQNSRHVSRKILKSNTNATLPPRFDYHFPPLNFGCVKCLDVMQVNLLCLRCSSHLSLPMPNGIVYAFPLRALNSWCLRKKKAAKISDTETQARQVALMQPIAACAI